MSDIFQKLAGLVFLIMFIGFSVFLLTVVGKLRLTLQTVIHRRNILFVGLMCLLMEIFDVIPRMSFFVMPDDRVDQLVPVLQGGLVLYCIYTFVEYLYCLYGDALTAYYEVKELKNKKMASGLSFLFAPVGLLRLTFDLMLPTFAFLFVLSLYTNQLNNFSRQTGAFFSNHLKQ